MTSAFGLPKFDLTIAETVTVTPDISRGEAACSISAATSGKGSIESLRALVAAGALAVSSGIYNKLR